MGVTTLVRVLIFLAVLGVVMQGYTLDASNPAAAAFCFATGDVGYRIFGLVFFCAAIISVVGAAYTSVSFLKTLFKPIGQYENLWIIGFIIASAIILVLIGKPATLLIVAGSLNGLILLVTLAVMLIAAKRKDIIGEYKHSPILLWSGWAVVIIAAYIGFIFLQGILKLI